MTIYAYCRVSTQHQLLERQTKNIKAAYSEIKPADYYLEKFTGTTTDRPEWKKLEKKLKEGDTVIFDSVSRMSRQAAEGFELYKRLYERGVNLVFLKEPYINTDQYRQAMQISLPDVEDSCLKPLMNGLKETLMLLAQRQFIAAFEQAEKEVQDTRQRIKEGMTVEVRKKMSESKTGKTRISKKSLELKPRIRKLAKAFEGTLSDKDVIEALKLRPNTYYKYKKELKEEMAKEKGSL